MGRSKPLRLLCLLLSSIRKKDVLSSNVHFASSSSLAMLIRAVGLEASQGRWLAARVLKRSPGAAVSDQCGQTTNEELDLANRPGPAENRHQDTILTCLSVLYGSLIHIPECIGKDIRRQGPAHDRTAATENALQVWTGRWSDEGHQHGRTYYTLLLSEENFPVTRFRCALAVPALPAACGRGARC